MRGSESGQERKAQFIAIKMYNFDAENIRGGGGTRERSGSTGVPQNLVRAA